MNNPLREFRKLKNLTQEQLASLLGCHQSFVSHVETGRCQMVSAETAAQWHKKTKGALSKKRLRPDIFGQPRNTEETNH